MDLNSKTVQLFTSNATAGVVNTMAADATNFNCPTNGPRGGGSYLSGVQSSISRSMISDAHKVGFNKGGNAQQAATTQRQLTSKTGSNFISQKISKSNFQANGVGAQTQYSQLNARSAANGGNRISMMLNSSSNGNNLKNNLVSSSKGLQIPLNTPNTNFYGSGSSQFKVGLNQTTAASETAVKASTEKQDNGFIPFSGIQKKDALRDYISKMYAITFHSSMYKQSFEQCRQVKYLGESQKPFYHAYEQVVNLALIMAESLGLNAEQFLSSDTVMIQRILTYYVPLVLWIDDQISQGKKDFGVIHQKFPWVMKDNVKIDNRAICIGLSLPQGGGKTTLMTPLKAAFDYLGIKIAVVSYDDFYLTHEDQQKLAKSHPDNFFLQGRGPAGTHDMKLAKETLHNLINCEEDAKVTIPQYDKSAFDGQGDRIDYEKHPELKIESGPVDLVLVEGWMVGHQAVDATKSKAIIDNPGMEFINEELKKYDELNEMFDSAILVTVDDSKIVYNWREQQEQDRRDSGAGSLSPEEVKTFCQRFIPSYDAYLDNLSMHGIPDHVPKDRTLKFLLGPNREAKVDNLEMQQQVIDTIDDFLADSAGKAALLQNIAQNGEYKLDHTEMFKYLLSNNEFTVSRFTQIQPNWVKNTFRE